MMPQAAAAVEHLKLVQLALQELVDVAVTAHHQQLVEPQ
jgi:hypothetical protein